MRVAFVSNFLNHHQKPFCSAMWEQHGKNFCVISTRRMTDERMNMGWKMDEIPPYEIRTYESEENRIRAREAVENSDVVIIGSVPDVIVQERLKKKKLTFKYSERLYKTGTPWRRFFRDAAAAWLHHGRFQRYPLYMLCASAFTAADVRRFGNYANRCYKWGYFPPTMHYDEEKLFAGKENEIPTILWVGRYLELKHPDDVVRAAVRLHREGYQFRLKFIGDGPLKSLLHDMVAEEKLDCVEFLGTMKPEQVREHMERANIYLFTSDRNEGWGAVLNESMNSGCAVVASHAIGSVPFLVKNGENGLVYRSCDVDSLYQRLKFLLDKPEECIRMGRNAYHTIVDNWNAEEAAERLVLLFEDIQKNSESTRFPDGPCSKAQIIKDNWFAN